MEYLDVRRTHNDLCWYHSVLHNCIRLEAINFFELNRRDCHRGHALYCRATLYNISVQVCFRSEKNRAVECPSFSYCPSSNISSL